LGTPDLDRDQLQELSIERILPNSRQPRQSFDEDGLNELASSIREHGVVQPVVVRPLDEGFYQLMAGERRWRAAQRAGLTRIPAIVRDSGARDDLEIALIENLQREDLNPMEEAQAFERLMVDYGLTQEEVAKRVGKNRATVANVLRLLRLPPEVQQWLRENRLTTGHAKALLSLSDLSAILDAARKIIQGNYSVRQAEMLVSRQAAGSSRPVKGAGEPQASDPNVQAAIRALEQVLGTKVTIEESGTNGKIEIHYHSQEELNRLYEGLMRVRF